MRVPYEGNVDLYQCIIDLHRANWYRRYYSPEFALSQNRCADQKIISGVVLKTCWPRWIKARFFLPFAFVIRVSPQNPTRHLSGGGRAGRSCMSRVFLYGD